MLKQDIKRSSIDYGLLIAVVLLALIGTVTILSATGGSVAPTHLGAVSLGVCAFIFGWIFNYRVFEDRWKLLYAGIIVILVLVLIPGIGSYQRGSRSWFPLGFFSLQPSEICRVAVLLLSAAILDKYKKTMGDIALLVFLGGVLGAIGLLIMLQPDFSAIVVTAPAIFFLLYCAGVNVLYLLAAVLFGLFAGMFPLLWTYFSLNPQIVQNHWLAGFILKTADNFWCISAIVLFLFAVCWALWWVMKQFKITVPLFLMMTAGVIMSVGFLTGVGANYKIKPHQRKRLEAFLAPTSDPRGASYNVLQAQIAMGSGGLTGKGLFSGTQSRLGFVPEKHTDFVLAVVGEEMGLLGTLSVLGLYLLMLWRIMLIAYRASSGYGYLVCCGIFAMFFTYMLVNFGMLIGMAPVAGVPLPLISYGGSNLVASLWALGVVQSVHARRLSFR